jgi:hypothetical protein
MQDPDSSIECNSGFDAYFSSSCSKGQFIIFGLPGLFNYFWPPPTIQWLRYWPL